MTKPPHGNPKPTWQTGFVYVSGPIFINTKLIYLKDNAKSLVPLLACVFGGYLLIATTCLYSKSSHRAKRKGVKKEKIKCLRETVLSFDKGFSQHPSVSLGRGRRPNITFHQSFLNDRQTLSNKGFFSNAPSYCWLPPHWIKGLKLMGERLENRKRVIQHGGRN